MINVDTSTRWGGYSQICGRFYHPNPSSSAMSKPSFTTLQDHLTFESVEPQSWWAESPSSTTLSNHNIAPPPPPPQQQHRLTHAIVDLDVIINNVDILRRKIDQSRVGFAAVVKADAYGHGILPVSKALCQARVIDVLVVALIEEAITLRQGGIIAPILVMAGSYTSSYDQVIAYSLIPVVGNMQDLCQFSIAGKRLGKRVPVHLEVDVGMARLGFPLEDLKDDLAQHHHILEFVDIVGVMGHPSHAHNIDAKQTRCQQEAVIEATQKLQSLMITKGSNPINPTCHVATSGALVSLDAETIASAGMIRVGLAIYGIQPIPNMPISGIQAALGWFSSVVAIRKVYQGSSVGYDGVWNATRDSMIATIAVGFADGFPRSLSNRGYVVIRGKRAPVVGYVCMDYTMVDVTDNLLVEIGDQVTLIGEKCNDPRLVEVAHLAGTTPYEILSRISTRVPRRYKGGK